MKSTPNPAESRKRPLAVQIITRLIAGGAQYVVLSLAQGLRNHGWDSEIWCGPPIGEEGELLSKAHSLGINVRVIPHMRREISPVHDMRSYLHIRELARRFKPDVIHTHSSKAGIIGRLAGWGNAKVVFHTVHGLPFGYGKAFNDLLFPACERIAARHCTGIFCVANVMAKRMAEFRIAPADKIFVVPWGVDASRFEGTLEAVERVRLNLGSGPMIVIPARLAPDKGHTDAFAAIAPLVGDFPGLKLLLLGDGPLREELVSLAAKLGISGSVIFAGRISRDAMPDHLAAADMLLLPSYREGLPIVIAEGYLAGCPTVAYETDGVPELVIQDATGELVKKGEITALTAAIRKLLTDRALRAAYVRKGRELVRQGFDETDMVRKTVFFYNRAIEGKIRP